MGTTTTATLARRLLQSGPSDNLGLEGSSGSEPDIHGRLVLMFCSGGRVKVGNHQLEGVRGCVVDGVLHQSGERGNGMRSLVLRGSRKRLEVGVLELGCSIGQKEEEEAMVSKVTLITYTIMFKGREENNAVKNLQMPTMVQHKKSSPPGFKKSGLPPIMVEAW